MIIQALLTLLLFFSEGYLKYTTIGLLLLFDLVLFIGLFSGKWSYEEILTFAAIICSGMFLLFYIYSKSAVTTIFGIALVMLFLVIAIVDIVSKPVIRKNSYSEKLDKLQRPEEPAYYDTDSDSRFRPEPVTYVKPEVDSDIKSKLAAKADAYELEREARQLKNAEKLIREMEVYNSERKLLKETTELENAQKKINAINSAVKDVERAKTEAEELKREAREILKVQKQINDIKKIQEIEREAKNIKKAEKQITAIKNIQEIQKEAKALKKAEKQIKELQFLDQQEKVVKQAKAIAKAQKDIDALKSKKPAKPATVTVKTVKTMDESFYFATETGNKFHEPGCMAIKKVPKNKLTLFTNKKEALKKGLQPCSVCIPK